LNQGSVGRRKGRRGKKKRQSAIDDNRSVRCGHLHLGLAGEKSWKKIDFARERIRRGPNGQMVKKRTIELAKRI